MSVLRILYETLKIMLNVKITIMAILKKWKNILVCNKLY